MLCEASSWRGASHQPYGPGGFNRCVLEDDGHTEHRDDFGNVFIFYMEGQRVRFKVIRHEGALS